MDTTEPPSYVLFMKKGEVGIGRVNLLYEVLSCGALRFAADVNQLADGRAVAENPHDARVCSSADRPTVREISPMGSTDREQNVNIR